MSHEYLTFREIIRVRQKGKRQTLKYMEIDIDALQQLWEEKFWSFAEFIRKQMKKVMTQQLRGKLTDDDAELLAAIMVGHCSRLKAWAEDYERRVNRNRLM